MSGAAQVQIAGFFPFFDGLSGLFGLLLSRARFLCGFLGAGKSRFLGCRDTQVQRKSPNSPTGFSVFSVGLFGTIGIFGTYARVFSERTFALPARHLFAHARHFCSAIVTASSSLYAAHLIIHIVTISAAGFPLHAVRMCLGITLIRL